MFLEKDIYTSFGNLKLFNCWTPEVTKHSSNTFYNWEYDNLPLHDLDERTSFLWQRMGFPTSAINGIGLTVSADSPESIITCNSNIFRSLNSCIDSLPDVINFPIVIEIANFNKLGNIKLSNIKFGTNGSLEIINRNFTTSYPGISNGIGSNIPITEFRLDRDSTPTDLNEFCFASGIQSWGGIGGIDPALSPTRGFFQTSCLGISAAVFSSIRDSRLSGSIVDGSLIPSLFGIGRAVNYLTGDLIDSKSTLITSPNNNINPYTVEDASRINFRSYEYNPDPLDNISRDDIKILDYASLPIIYPQLGTHQAAMLLYGNSISKIEITNCDGPIILRNMFVDGEFLPSSNTGILINNSTKVYLENTVTTRFRKSGIEINNSDVTLLRSFVSTRNYNFNTDGVRLGVMEQGNADIENAMPNFGVGLLANNSNINISSTANWEKLLFDEKLQTITNGGVEVYPNHSIAPESSYIVEFSKNSTGMILNNCKLFGGTGNNIENSLFNANDFLSNTKILFQFNNNIGLKANNCEIDYSGRIEAFYNYYGISIYNSILLADKLYISNNQDIGINLVKSTLKYNKNKNTLPDSESKGQVHFSLNGRHLNLYESKMVPTITSSMQSNYGKMAFSSTVGSGTINPAITVDKSSECILVCPAIVGTHSNNTPEVPNKSSEILVDNSSNCILIGNKNQCNLIQGTLGDYSPYTQKSAIYANRNSTLEINGPTLICNYDIDLYGDNSSNILINPQRVSNSDQYDVKRYNLSDRLNHTSVELHSNKSCIVVDNNSKFNAKDLGSFFKSWSKSLNGSGALGIVITNFAASNIGGQASDDSNQEYSFFSNNAEESYVFARDASSFTYGGSLQFYPNPECTGNEISRIILQSQISDTFVEQTASDTNFNLIGDGDSRSTVAGASQYTPTNPYGPISSITNGGICVKASNNSIVNIKNVNFPCGWINTSGNFYDFNTTGLDWQNRLFIWNITDSSILDCKFVSVGGGYPMESNYHGPTGHWVSGNGLLCLGAPIGTVDTTNYSLLDYYGKTLTNATSVNSYAKTIAENYGPFRLYFSVNPMINIYSASANDISRVGYINQIYAQGYQWSSTLFMLSSAHIPKQFASGLYTVGLGKSGNSLITSGFLYANTIINRANAFVLLDKSGSELFANAKHCSVGKSNIPLLVHIRHSNRYRFGDGTNDKPEGIGFRTSNSFYW